MKHFSEIEDHRASNARRHDLHELLMIALCSSLCGGLTCVDMADYAENNEPFLREFLALKNGLPSHDTFSRLFRCLDPEMFDACFRSFMADFADAVKGVIAVDGKTLRRSFDAASGRSPLHMVSAWASENRLVLAQVATDEKSNEITAIPKLLALLSLEGATVTIDAMETQPRHRAADRRPVRELRAGPQGEPGDAARRRATADGGSGSTGDAVPPHHRRRPRTDRDAHGDGRDEYRFP